MALDVLPVSVTVICARAPFSSCGAGIVVVHVVAVEQLVVKGVVTPRAVKFTTELAVKPLPFTVRFGMVEAPALAENGEIEAMLNAPAPPRFRSQTPRPSGAARSVRDAFASPSSKFCALAT